MRTIKFRGRRIDNGEWVYGDLEIRRNTGVCLIHTYNDDDTYKEQFEVVPDSVGQFTGFYDKNRIEVYENDVLAWKFKRTYKVIWYIAKGRFILMNTQNRNDTMDCYFDDIEDEFEVIGNIHDNPNLSEGGTK